MKTLTTALIAKQHALQGLGTWLWLFELQRDGTNVDRWVQDNADVVFNSQTFTHKNLTFEPSMADMAGSTHPFTLTIGDADRTIRGRLNDGYYRGRRITVYKVNRSALSSVLNCIKLRGKILSADAEEGAASFTCGSFNLRNTTIPRDSLYRTICRWEFKGPCGECGYAGVLTTCDKKFSTCDTLMSNKTRFGGIPSLPTENV